MAHDNRHNQTCHYQASGVLTCSSVVEGYSTKADQFPARAPRHFSRDLKDFEASPAGGVGPDHFADIRQELAKCEHYFVLVMARSKTGDIHTLERYYSRARDHFGKALELINGNTDFIERLRQTYTLLAMRARDAIDAAVNRAAMQGYAHQVGHASAYIASARKAHDAQKANRAWRICNYVSQQSDVPKHQAARCAGIIEDATRELSK